MGSLCPEKLKILFKVREPIKLFNLNVLAETG
jgi:hypothetical protein